MEICKMMTLSLDHISEKTIRFLEEAVESGEVVCYEKEGYGFWIFTRNYYDDIDAFRKNVPEDLFLLMGLSFAHGCDWLCLDVDGPIEEFLVTYGRSC